MAPGFQDGHLLGGDGAPGTPEDRLVIEADRREHGDLGVDDVGRVEPAAEPDLEHGDVDLALVEVAERHHRERLELRERDRRLTLDRRPHEARPAREVRGQDGVAADAHALGDADEVRARVEADAIAGGVQDRREEGGGRALAVGAGHGHGEHVAVRVTEAREGGLDALEAELDAAPGEAREPGLGVREGPFGGRWEHDHHGPRVASRSPLGNRDLSPGVHRIATSETW